MGSKPKQPKLDVSQQAYNREMAELSELQRKMANEYFKFWQEYYKPLEREQIAANRELLPLQIGLEKGEMGLREAEVAAERELIPYQTEAAKLGLETQALEMGKRKELIPKFYEEAMSGVDVEKRKTQAQAAVQHAFGNVAGQIGRTASRYGISPTSGAFADMARTSGIELAKGIAGATTAAETQAEQEKFKRLTAAYQGSAYGLGG